MFSLTCAFLALASSQAREEDSKSQDFPEFSSEEPSPLRVSLSSGARYLQGDFGTTSMIRIAQFVETAALSYDRLEASISGTYLLSETTGTGAASVGGGGLPFFQGEGTGGTQTTVERRSGVGDTYANLGLSALSQDEVGLSVQLSGGAKIPTADEDKGLGTGEYDFFGYLTINRRLEDWIFIARGGRIFMGDTETIDFRDSWAAAVALGRRFSVGEEAMIELRVWGRGQTAVLKDAPDPVEAALTLDYTPNRSISFTVEGAAGLTDGAPDYTAGLGLRLSF